MPNETNSVPLLLEDEAILGRSKRLRQETSAGAAGMEEEEGGEEEMISSPA